MLRVSSRTWIWRIGAVATVTASLLLVSLLHSDWPWRVNTPADPGVARLAAALGGERVVVGQLTGFPYAPLSTAERDTDPTDNVALLAAAGELQRAASERPTAVNLHAWGIAQLSLGRYDDAVLTLEASRLESATPNVTSDLAVALLARASALDRPEDLPRALEYLEEALASHPDKVESLFTKALVLEPLQMSSLADHAWARYLQLAPESEWRSEAQERLSRLRTRSSAGAWQSLEQELMAGTISADRLAHAARDYTSDVRDLWVREILPAWASRVGTAEAGESLAAAERVAAALDAAGQDQSFARVLARIRSASPRTQRAIAAGVDHLAAGLRAQATDRPAAETVPHLTAADDALLAAACPELRLWAVLGLARAASLQAKPDDVVRLAEDVVKRTGSDAPALGARAHAVLGPTLFARSNWSRALHHYEEALRLANRSGDDAIASSAHFNLGQLYRFLGNRAETWKHRLAAAAVLPLHRPIQVHVYLTIGAATASVEDLPRAALLFQDEVVLNADRAGAAGQKFEARVSRARLRNRAGMPAAAANDLKEAALLLGAVGNPDRQARFARALALARAEVTLSSTPGDAVQEAGRAISMITAEQEPIRLAEARLFESRALARAGQPEAALTSARLGIEAFERGLATIDAGELTRISALEPVWALYAEAARLALDSQPRGVSEAFALSERGRARTLLDLNRLTPLALSEAQRRLHPHQAVLVVDQSPDTLLTWWITRDDVAVNRTELSAAALARLVERHRRSIDRGARHDEASAELHGIALARRPPQVTAIAVVADGSWNHVAWPALWDRTTNREVVRDLSIVVSPSVSLALRATATDIVPLDRALIVAAPLVSGARPLPGARLEARDIAAIYRGARLLDGDAATAEGVLNASAESAIVHVSSHAVDVPAYPQMSHLVLAGGSESRHLYVKDVARTTLPHTRVVVLAACATAGRRAIRGEGSIGMAWGFLTAGVPQVVATLQEIEDAPARTFFIRLHQHLGAGLSAPDALRATQRELADAGESPRTWAVVVAMGRL